MPVTITSSMVDHLLEFLGYDGWHFFKKVYEEHGTYNAGWPVEYTRTLEDGSTSTSTFPHVVHFQEGMQVRNCLRRHPDCEGWTDHDFDNHWDKVVAKCMERPVPPPPKNFWNYLED